MVFRRLFYFVSFLLMCVTQIAVAQGQSRACPGFTTRLTIGQPGIVLPGPPNNVRNQPSSQGTRIGQIPANGQFDVLEGPVCANGYTWWQVDYDGLVGWTAEGTPQEHWLDAVQASSPSIPVNTSALNSSVPAFVINGLAFYGGGGGGFTLCGSRLEDRRNIFALRPLIHPDFSDADSISEAIEVSRGDIVQISRLFPPLFSTINRIEVMPQICSRLSVDQAIAISPTNQIMAVKKLESFGFDGDVLTLPIEAYTQPGMWMLQVGDFQISVQIQHQDAGILEDYDRSLRLIAGFDPGEQVTLFYPDPEAYDNPDAPNVQMVDVHVDSSGSLLMPLDSVFLQLVAIVGQNGNVTTNLLSKDGYRIPRNFSEELLYEIVRNQNMVDFNNWTCPNNLPPRLNTFGNAAVIRGSGSQPVYAEPNLESQQLFTMPENVIVSVNEGVTCASGATWWRVSWQTANSGFQWGYVVESYQGRYFFEPR